MTSVVNKQNFYKANYEDINFSINTVNWDQIFNNNTIIQNVNKFYNILNSIIGKFVPVNKHKPSTYPKWFSFELISSVINKKKIHKKWIQYGNQSDYIEFKRLRAICLKLSKRDRQKYIQEIEEEAKINVKSFWNYVGGLTKGNDFPGEMFFGDKVASSSKGICNLFAKNFELVYLTNPSKFYHSIYYGNNLDITINETDIINAITKLKNKVSLDPDGLCAFFVKSCSSSISTPLLALFKQSLHAGLMPPVWKKTFITPVYKSGNCQDISNYRPISIMGSISKILDTIVTEKMTILCISKIINEQHGFVEGRSTLTNLALYSHYIANALKNYRQVDSVYLDFSKAFDSVNHNILTLKLHNAGISGKLLKWIFSYLGDREQMVRIEGNLSDSYFNTSGVPQGSSLGPLLFIIFINDITHGIRHSKVLIFADDVKLFSSVNSIYDQVQVQIDLEKIALWAQVNQLKLNLQKCKVLSFGRGRVNSFTFQYRLFNEDLELVTKMKDLGILFQSNFEFKEHLDIVVSRSLKLLGFIKRSTKEFKNTDTIMYLYKTIIKPVLMYGSIIWSPHYDVDLVKLESPQHRLLRYLSFKRGVPVAYDQHDYEDISRLFGLASVKSEHIFQDIFFVKKITLGLIKSNELVNLFNSREVPYQLRDPRQLEEFSASPDYVRYSTIFRLRRKFNKTPITIRSQNRLSLFKDALRNHVSRFK